MIIFCIQAEKIKDNVLPMNEFSYTLLEAIKYNNWFYNEKLYDYIFNVEPYNYSPSQTTNYIPIGSVEYVTNWINYKYINKMIKPINIPFDLSNFNDDAGCYYTSRNMAYNSFPESCQTKNVFIKDNSKIKGVAELVPVDKFNEFIKLHNLKEYVVSEEKDISSEWRAFVYNYELLDIRNYSGEFYYFPDIDLIRCAVRDYKNCPPAYTMDFGIDDNGENFLIECHNFFSCGLYGFADYKNLPQMFIKSYKWQLQQ